MKLKRKQNLKNAILAHIAKTIRGELQSWNHLDFKFSNDTERFSYRYV